MSGKGFWGKLLLAAGAILLLPSCGSSQEITGLSSKDYGITIDQDHVILGDSLEKHRALLGNTKREVRFEEVYNRDQAVYSLNGIEIASYVDFTNTIDTMQIFTKSVKTYRGLGVGNTREQILAKYPKPDYESAEIIVFSLSGPVLSGWSWNLSFFLENNKVYKVSYNMAGP